MKTPGKKQNVSDSEKTKPGANGVIKTSTKKKRVSKFGSEESGASVLTETETEVKHGKRQSKGQQFLVTDNSQVTPKQKRKIEKEEKNPGGSDSDQIHKKKQRVSKTGDWTNEDNLNLMKNVMKYLKRINCSDSFSKGLKKVDWEEVKIKNYSAEVCKLKLPAILSGIRDRKTMLESVTEAHKYYIDNLSDE